MTTDDQFLCNPDYVLKLGWGWLWRASLRGGERPTDGSVSAAGERAVVRYSYTAEQPDELTLKEGEVIRVLDKHLEDEGWWRGEVNGKIGVFPDNFVEILPTQEEVGCRNAEMIFKIFVMVMDPFL